MHLIGWLSLYCLVVFFSGALIFSFIWTIFFNVCWHAYYIVRGWSLRCLPELGNQRCCVMMLYVGEGSEREQCRLLSSQWLLVTSSATHKQIGPFWSWFPGGWFWVHSRMLGVSPTNSLVRLGVCPAAGTPIGFFSQRFWDFISLHWKPGLFGFSCSPVIPPGLSACECGTSWSASSCLAWSTRHSLTWSISHHPLRSSTSCLAASPFHPSCPSPPLLLAWMNVSSLTPWLPDFHTVWFFWQFWLYFVFQFVVVLLVVQGGKGYLPTPPSWPEVQTSIFSRYLAKTNTNSPSLKEPSS